MLEMSSFSTDAGLQPSPPLFDSLVNDTLFHISIRIRVYQSLLKFLYTTNGLVANTFL